ncbi:unnamed protein product [Cylicocyclus nassatus]|uniref:Uncharacterized protein n=1 Tax=Cylicocyclus nassatus TaxID=53992 RepID=A0AA36DPE9_CYLNA|nr:unnamed protein product [Cylicocyclus nassatus]
MRLKMNESAQGWQGEELITCRHGEYGYTSSEWAFMVVVTVCAILICVLAYFEKIYVDGNYRLRLLLEYLPTPEIVMRYNKAGDTVIGIEKTQETKEEDGPKETS